MTGTFHFPRSSCHLPRDDPVYTPALGAPGLCSHTSLNEELTTSLSQSISTHLQLYLLKGFSVTNQSSRIPRGQETTGG